MLSNSFERYIKSRLIVFPLRIGEIHQYLVFCGQEFMGTLFITAGSPYRVVRWHCAYGCRQNKMIEDYPRSASESRREWSLIPVVTADQALLRLP